MALSVEDKTEIAQMVGTMLADMGPQLRRPARQEPVTVKVDIGLDEDLKPWFNGGLEQLAVLVQILRELRKQQPKAAT